MTAPGEARPGTAYRGRKLLAGRQVLCWVGWGGGGWLVPGKEVVARATRSLLGWLGRRCVLGTGEGSCCQRNAFSAGLVGAAVGGWYWGRKLLAGRQVLCWVGWGGGGWLVLGKEVVGGAAGSLLGWLGRRWVVGTGEGSCWRGDRFSPGLVGAAVRGDSVSIAAGQGQFRAVMGPSGPASDRRRVRPSRSSRYRPPSWP
jgi:hypothetical protein